MELCLGDIVVLKKGHACGCAEFEILRVGMDIRIKCTGCAHEIMLPRSKFEKSIKKFIKKSPDKE